MVEIDIKPFWGIKPARAVWRNTCNHGPPFGRIFLTRGVCDHCKMDLINEEDYIFLLEHEMVEIITAIILDDDGIKHNPDGFNNMYARVHWKTKFHFCDKNNKKSVMVRLG